MFKYDKHLRLTDKRYAWDYLRTDSIDNFNFKKDLVLENLRDELFAVFIITRFLFSETKFSNKNY